MERRKRSSLVLPTNSFAEPSSAGPAPATVGADGELAGGAVPVALEEDAQDSSRPAMQKATTRMAAHTTLARPSPHRDRAWSSLGQHRSGLADLRQLVAGALRVLGQAARRATQPAA